MVFCILGQEKCIIFYPESQGKPGNYCLENVYESCLGKLQEVNCPIVVEYFSYSVVEYNRISSSFYCCSTGLIPH